VHDVQGFRSATDSSWGRRPVHTTRRHRKQRLNLISKPFWVAGPDQMSDVFTKALDKTSFLRCRGRSLGIPGC